MLLLPPLRTAPASSVARERGAPWGAPAGPGELLQEKPAVLPAPASPLLQLAKAPGGPRGPPAGPRSSPRPLWRIRSSSPRHWARRPCWWGRSGTPARSPQPEGKTGARGGCGRAARGTSVTRTEGREGGSEEQPPVALPVPLGKDSPDSGEGGPPVAKRRGWSLLSSAGI